MQHIACLHLCISSWLCCGFSVVVDFYLRSHAWDCDFQRPYWRGDPGLKSHNGCGFSSVDGDGCCQCQVSTTVLCSNLGCDVVAVIAHRLYPMYAVWHHIYEKIVLNQH